MSSLSMVCGNVVYNNVGMGIISGGYLHTPTNPPRLLHGFVQVFYTPQSTDKNVKFNLLKRVYKHNPQHLLLLLNIYNKEG